MAIEARQAVEQDSAFDQVRSKVASGDIAAAIQDLVRLFEASRSELYNDTLVLSSRLVDLETRVRKGVLPRDEAEAERSKIRYATLQLVDEAIAAPGASTRPDGPHDFLRVQSLQEFLYLLDRRPQVSSFRATVTEACRADRRDSRPIVAAILGEPDHEHQELIRRIERDVLHQQFADEPGYQRAEYVEWPPNPTDSDVGLDTLCVQVQDLLKTRDSAPNSIAGALNDGVGPRLFFSCLRSSQFSMTDHALLGRWFGFWEEVAACGLNAVVAIFLCLEIDGPPPSQPRGWFSRWRAVEPPPALKDCIAERFSNPPAGLRLHRLEIGLCQPVHLHEWHRSLADRGVHQSVVERAQRIHAVLRETMDFSFRQIRRHIEQLQL